MTQPQPNQHQQLPTRSVGAGLQLRPRTGVPAVDSQVYAPHRDLAHNFASLATAAVNGLRPETTDPWLKSQITALGVTGDDLGKALVAFTRAVVAFSDPDCESPHAALTAAGFFETAEAAQFVISAKFGQVMYGAVFSAVRDVTHVGERPPMQANIDKMVQEAEATAALLCGFATADDDA
jgi:hypothetical protein